MANEVITRTAAPCRSVSTVPPARSVAELAAAQLEDLGESVDQVLAAARTLGLRGRRKSPCDCPFAQLLLADTRVCRVTVFERAAVLRDWTSAEYQVDMPSPVAEVIALFDGGAFDELAGEPRGPRRGAQSTEPPANWPHLQVGTLVRNGTQTGHVSERLTTRTATGPHREIAVRYPNGATSVHVNAQIDDVQAL